MVDASLVVKSSRFLDVFNDTFVLRNENSDKVTVINRHTFDIKPSVAASSVEQPGVSTNMGKRMPIFGVLGSIRLLTSQFLIVITGCNVVGRIRSSQVFQVTNIEFVALSQNTSLSDQSAKEQDKRYMNMIKEVALTGCMYFSHDYDLTHTLQRIAHFSEETRSKPLWARADLRFFWNRFLMGDLIKAGADDWILPVFNGFFQYELCTLKGQEFELLLISRRDWRRTGTRFFIRGLDQEGNAANFAESEQLVVLKQDGRVRLTSYVQTRGSMPFIWEQKPNLAWAPKGKAIADSHKSVMASQLHFKEQFEVYNGNQVCVNLIDKKKNQKELGEVFDSIVRRLPDADRARIRLVWFDFHHECRKMKWHNLSKLVDQVKEDLDSHSYFLMDESLTSPLSLAEQPKELVQRGAFRTNCMDCLDRTNVVQSVLARRMLHTQLHKLGLVPKAKGEPFEEFPERLEFFFKDMWANNADIMSILYSGTGALKTDFTRTGKRTKAGAIQDGRNSIHRYVLNNFYDGERQDCIDFFLGKFRVGATSSPKLKRSRPIIPFFLGMFTFALFISYTVKETVANKENPPPVPGPLVFLGAFMLSLAASFKFARMNHKKFVDSPRLCPQC
eukprot:GILI01009935.1.p1 GENE.GILI01009935.1~~GILI01009935.1.p1  ORF type:complete len:646 (+),score=188.70 GILI01009935.1:92-1939(+)